MAATLETILTEVKKNGKELVGIKNRLSSLEKKVGSLDKQVAGLEKDMKKVLKCVATENANFKIKRPRSSSGYSSGMAMAAKSK